MSKALSNPLNRPGITAMGSYLGQSWLFIFKAHLLILTPFLLFNAVLLILANSPLGASIEPSGLLVVLLTFLAMMPLEAILVGSLLDVQMTSPASPRMKDIFRRVGKNFFSIFFQSFLLWCACYWE